MNYEIAEVNGEDNRATIEHFNSLAPETFPPLELKHLKNGFWFLAFDPDGNPVAFAGMVPFLKPGDGIGYFKRCFTKVRGHGLQYRLMAARSLKARRLGWRLLVSECHKDNTHSAANFARFGFEQFEPDQPWAQNSIFWRKTL